MNLGLYFTFNNKTIYQICEFRTNLQDVLDLDDTIRFSMIIADGVKKFGGYRYDTIKMLDSEELEQSIWYAHERMAGRRIAEHKLGKTKYAFAEYGRVKRITFPLNSNTLLLVSLDIDSDHNKIIQLILKMLK